MRNAASPAQKFATSNVREQQPIVNAGGKSIERRRVTIRKVEPATTVVLIYLTGDITPNDACPAQRFSTMNVRGRTTWQIVQQYYSKPRTTTGTIAKECCNVSKANNKRLNPSSGAKNGKRTIQKSFRYTVNERSKSIGRRPVTIQKVEPARTAMLIYLAGDITPKSACLARHLHPGRA